MAEIVRIAEPAEPAGTPSLPQNIEAEAALLGALMIDNRLVEDVQLKLRPHHFFEPLHGRIYEADPAHDRQATWSPTRSRCGRCSRRRGDEGGRRPRLSRPAHRIGRGADRRARFRPADLRPRLAARAGRGRPRAGRARARHLRRGRAAGARSRRPRPSSTRSPRRAGPRARPRSFGEATTRWRSKMAERALNSGGHLSGLTTGLDSLNGKIGGMHNSDLIIVAGRPGMGKTALGTNIAFAAAQRFLRDRRTGSSPKVGRRPGRLVQPRNVGRPARHAHPRRAVGDQLGEPAHGQDQPAGLPPARARRRPSSRACRCTSTIRPA